MRPPTRLPACWGGCPSSRMVSTIRPVSGGRWRSTFSQAFSSRSSASSVSSSPGALRIVRGRARGARDPEPQEPADHPCRVFASMLNLMSVSMSLQVPSEHSVITSLLVSAAIPNGPRCPILRSGAERVIGRGDSAAPGGVGEPVGAGLRTRAGRCLHGHFHGAATRGNNHQELCAGEDPTAG